MRKGKSLMELKQLTIKASAWTVSEYFFTQGVRFLSNVILTRLIIPEYFGLMQLVLVFTFGLEVLSDLGVKVNIIQHKRGGDKAFLQTAWTFQVMRGILLWILSIALAIPFAKLYGHPELMKIIPIAAIGTLFTGFTSTNLYLLQKHLQIRAIALINITASIVSTLVMLILAWTFHSIWALVSAGLVFTGIRTLLSFIVEGVKMRFSWDREVIREIVHFGKWIIVSSLLGFFVSQLDKLYLGLEVSAATLGFYGIASAITLAFIRLVQVYGEMVLLPLFRKLLEETVEDMRRKIKKIRHAILLSILPPLFILALFGKEICAWIYPENFSEVGVILQILSLGTAASIIPITIGPILLAAGNPFRVSVLITTRIIVQLLLMYFGNLYFGFYGIVYAVAFAEICIYPVIVLCIHQYKVWMPTLDLGYLACCLVIGFFGGIF